MPRPVMQGPPGGEQHLLLAQVQTLVERAAPASEVCFMSARRQQAACLAGYLGCAVLGARASHSY